MRLEVMPRHLDVAPGEPVALEVEVYNTSDVIDGFVVSLVGVTGQPFTATPPVLSLFPGTDGVLTVAFVLPAGFPAGPHTIGVKVASTTDPEDTRVEEVGLDVAAVRDARLAIDPQSVTGGGKAVFVVSLENAGNVAVDAPLAAADAERHLAFAFVPGALTVAPGEKQMAQASAAGRRPFFGSPVPRPFTVTASDPGGPPLEVVGSFVQKPLLPRGILTLLSVLAAVALWGLVLLLGVDKAVKAGVEAGKGDDAGAATEGEAQAGGGAGAPGTGGPGTVSGVVVAGDDPAGAMVALAPLAEGTIPAGPPPTPLLVSSAGKYEFKDMATPATYRLTVSKVGFGSQIVVVKLGSGETKTVDVRLLDGDGGINGGVSDGRAPLANVAVTAVSGADKASTISQPTAPVGSYSLLRLPTPATYVVTFAKDGYGSETIVVELVPGQIVGDRNVVLRQGNGSLSGTVADAAGLPIPDVNVAVSRAGAPVGATRSLGTGSVGFFSLGGLPTPGTYAVEFSKEGYLSETRSVTLGEAGNVTDVNPRLNPVTGTLGGLVSEDFRKVPACRPGPDECPLDGVEVKVTDGQGAVVKATTSVTSPADQVGRYSMVGIPAGDYTVTFSKVGYVPQTIRITLAANEQRVLDARLRGLPGAVAGNAQSCVSVEVVLRDGSRLPSPLIARVRTNGDYQFSRVETRGQYVMVFRDAANVTDEAFEIDIDAGEKLTGVDGTCTSPPPPPTTTSTTCPFFECLFPPMTGTT